MNRSRQTTRCHRRPRRSRLPMKDGSGPGRQASGAFFVELMRMAGGSMCGRPSQVRVLSFEEALQVVLHHAARVRAPEAETVGLLASAGRVLGEEVRADRDQPPFDRATRDGFAVRAGEWTAGR